MFQNGDFQKLYFKKWQEINHGRQLVKSMLSLGEQSWSFRRKRLDVSYWWWVKISLISIKPWIIFDSIQESSLRISFPSICHHGVSPVILPRKHGTKWRLCSTKNSPLVPWSSSRKLELDTKRNWPRWFLCSCILEQSAIPTRASRQLYKTDACSAKKYNWESNVFFRWVIFKLNVNILNSSLF